MALADISSGLSSGDASLCARAMRAAIRVADDDSEETIRLLGFKIPERIK
jgi:hypothetical protein